MLKSNYLFSKCNHKEPSFTRMITQYSFAFISRPQFQSISDENIQQYIFYFSFYFLMQSFKIMAFVR